MKPDPRVRAAVRSARAAVADALASLDAAAESSFRLKSATPKEPTP